jgi:hypothetical protein
VSERKATGLGVVGLGAAACAVCCAGPILAFLGGLGLAGLVSTWFIGWAGLAVAVSAALAWVITRHRRQSRCSAPASAPVPVAPPQRRAPRPVDGLRE